MADVAALRDTAARTMTRRSAPLLRRAILGGQVVNQAKRIVPAAARKIWLVFDDLTTVLYETEFGLLSSVNRDFENRSKRRTSFNKQVDMPPVQADHVGFLVRDFESDDLSPRGVRSARNFLVGGVRTILGAA